MGNQRNQQKRIGIPLEIAAILVGVGATILFSVLPPKNTLMRFILGAIAMSFLLYGGSIIILSRIRKMHIPFWLVLVLGAIIGAGLFGWVWNQTIGAYKSIWVSSLSNAEFRERVIQFANELREFERNFKSREMERKLTLLPPTGTKEQRAQINRERRARDDERYQEYVNEFNRKYLAEATDYRGELYRRLHETPPKHDPFIMGISKGIFAGPSPLNDFATHLERLAKRLGD